MFKMRYGENTRISGGGDKVRKKVKEMLVDGVRKNMYKIRWRV